MSADAARVALVDAAAPHAGAPPRAHVVRRQGGGGHRGFAFIECATPAEASLVLERLRHTPYGWAAEWVRPKGKKGRSGRGRRGGRRRGRRARQADDGGGGGVTADYAYASDDDVAELYGDDDFESEGDDEAAAPAPAPGLFVQDGGGGGGGDGGDGGSDGGGGDDDGGGGDEDDGGVACLRAMAAFVAESEAWAGGVQRFMVERCIDFDDSEEERLEWHTTHLAFRALMEALLEAELARLGVAAEEFAALLADHADSAAASSFLAGVLSMDDYPFFKREMLSRARPLRRAQLRRARRARGSGGPGGRADPADVPHARRAERSSSSMNLAEMSRSIRSRALRLHPRGGRHQVREQRARAPSHLHSTRSGAGRVGERAERRRLHDEGGVAHRAAD